MVARLEPSVMVGRLPAARRVPLGLAALLVVTLGAAGLRFWWLGRQSLWLDETVTWQLLHGSLLWLVFHGVPGRESTPPLYYVLAWGWVRLFGWSEAGLRSLSALFGTATVPVVFLAGCRLANERAGLAAAALAGASPFLVWYSQEARAYALFGLLAACSVWLFAEARHGGLRGRALWAWSGVCVLALTAQYFAVFLVAAEALLLSFSLPRRQLAAALVPPGVTCLLLAPLVYLQRHHAAGLAASTSLRTRLVQTASWATTGDLRSTTAWAIVACVGLVGLALLLQRRPSVRRNGLAALAVGAVALALPIVLALAGHDFVFFRNFIGVWIVALCVLGVALTGWQRRHLGIPALLLLVAVFIAADASVWTHPNQQRDNYRGLLAAMDPSRGTILIVYPGWDDTPLEHYDPALQPLTASHAVSGQVDLVGVSSDFGAWLPPAQLPIATPSYLRPIGSRTYQHFLIRSYTSRSLVHLTATGLEKLIIPRTRRPPIPATSVLIQR